MPFGAHVLAALENILSDGFEFHRELDSFLTRSGVDQRDLSLARSRAEIRAKVKSIERQWDRAPKRYVVEEVLRDLGNRGTKGDAIVANLVTAATRMDFSKFSKAHEAAEVLKRHQADDRKEKEAANATQHRQEQERGARDQAIAAERLAAKRRSERDDLLARFVNLNSHPDPQARGYELERLLNAVFEFEGLKPRESFKLTGEQIDGSFSWAQRTYLLEARWVKDPVAGLGFGSFIYKIGGKTADTRGLFISVNGYSQEAIKGLNGKGDLRFVCIDGAHLMRCLSPGSSLQSVLEEVWRHADETGEAYLPVIRMRNQ